jgi:hypothetical protein
MSLRAGNQGRVSDAEVLVTDLSLFMDKNDTADVSITLFRNVGLPSLHEIPNGMIIMLKRFKSYSPSTMGSRFS